MDSSLQLNEMIMNTSLLQKRFVPLPGAIAALVIAGAIANVVAAPLGAAPLGLHNAQYLSSSTAPTAGGGVDLRWSLRPTVLLLGDQDGDLRPMYISSVQIRNGRMTDASIAAMGAPTANKIPGCIKARQAGGSIVIEWTGTVLESASNPAGPWTELVAAAHPHTVTAPTGNKFFRVRQ